MTAARIRVSLLAATLCLSTAGIAAADVKSQERAQVKFEGMLGRMVGMFGGKAAKDGIVSTVAIKGDRKMNMTEDGGELIDLAEEKVYRINVKGKSYKVVTFDELRKQMQEAQKRAEDSAKRSTERQEQGKEPQMEVDFDIKETGQKRTITGYDCREILVTITVREKGKTLEQSGGFVMASNLWMAPEIPALKEQADFSVRYAKKLYGQMISVESMQQMASAMAMYPAMKQAMERMSKEQVNMKGTPLLTVMSFQTVQGPQQSAAREEDSGGGGLMGGLARRMMKKKDKDEGAPGTPGRATILTSTLEVLQVSTAVTPADVSVPAGFTQEK